MKHSEFVVGENFLCGGNKYRCTDKGTRVIVAFRLNKDPEYERGNWYNGPPYAVKEVVLDENDITGCLKEQV